MTGLGRALQSESWFWWRQDGWTGRRYQDPVVEPSTGGCREKWMDSGDRKHLELIRLRVVFWKGRKIIFRLRMAWSSGVQGSHMDSRALLQGGNMETGSWGEETGGLVQDMLSFGCLGMDLNSIHSSLRVQKSPIGALKLHPTQRHGFLKPHSIFLMDPTVFKIGYSTKRKASVS